MTMSEGRFAMPKEMPNTAIKKADKTISHLRITASRADNPKRLRQYIQVNGESYSLWPSRSAEPAFQSRSTRSSAKYEKTTASACIADISFAIKQKKRRPGFAGALSTVPVSAHPMLSLHLPSEQRFDSLLQGGPPLPASAAIREDASAMSEPADPMINNRRQPSKPKS